VLDSGEKGNSVSKSFIQQSKQLKLELLVALQSTCPLWIGQAASGAHAHLNKMVPASCVPIARSIPHEMKFSFYVLASVVVH
jgi:hypothetical protein